MLKRPKESRRTMMRCVCIAALFLLLVPRLAFAQAHEPDIETLCNPDRRVQTKSESKESLCLAQFRNVVTRTGDALAFKLDNGTTKIIKGNAKACQVGPCECAVYRLVGYITADRQFIVEALGYESGLVLLVSRRTGEVTELEDWPHLSPSRKRFVVVWASDDPEVKNAIAIFSTATDPPKLEWRFPNPKEYEQYSFNGWDGEDRVKLRVFTKGEIETEVNLTAEGWKLRRPNGEFSFGITSPPSRPTSAKPASKPAATTAPQSVPVR